MLTVQVTLSSETEADAEELLRRFERFLDDCEDHVSDQWEDREDCLSELTIKVGNREFILDACDKDSV